ncbi:MAG: ABC transporter permease [bacterium]|nr:ABC transporter permease [bacterium]
MSIARATSARQQRLLVATRRLRRRALSDRRWSNVALYIGGSIVVLVILAGLLAPWISPYPPNELNLMETLQPPSSDHFFGTDELGRDVFSRVLHGIRLDMAIVLVITYVPLLVGVTLGMLAGYFGGWVDTVVNRAVDIVMAFPFLVVVIAVVAITGPGLVGIFIGVLAVGWALYARLARGEMLVIREQQYMLAAKGLGYSTARILRRHAVPNLIRSPLVFSVADIVLNLLLIAGVSYLGLGVQAPTAELGVIVADGQAHLRVGWWITTLSGLVLVTIGVGFSMLGDALADRLGEELRLTV